MGAAAGALLPGEDADVTGAVAQQGEGLFIDGGEHQLALAALGQHLAGLGVDDLGDEVVLIDVHPALSGTLEGHAGAGQLGESVDVIGLDAHRLLDVLAHLLAPRLRTEDARLQGDLVGGHAHLVHTLAQIGGVGGGAAQDGGPQVTDELDLTVGVARGDGHGEAAHPPGTLVQADAAGEHAVAIGDLTHVLLAAANGGDGTGAAVGPQVDVVLGVKSHDPLSGGAGGGVDTHAFGAGHRHQAVGIVVPQVGLGGEGQLIQVGGGLDVLGSHALFLHLLAVGRDIVPHMAHLLNQALVLPGLDLFPRGALDLGLEISLHGYHSFLSCLSGYITGFLQSKCAAYAPRRLSHCPASTPARHSAALRSI